MNKKIYPFLLRFLFYFIVFTVALFLMIFLVNRNPSDNFRMLIVKIGIVGIVFSLIYNFFVERDPEIVE